MMQRVLCIMSTWSSETPEFCTINDSICPQNDGCTEVEDLSLFPLSDKTHIDYGLKELKGPVKAYHLRGSNCLNMIAILILL